jgi:RNA polymerase sigma-32 factor
MRQPFETDGLRFYFSQIDNCPVLNREEERQLAVRYKDFQDVEAGRILVLSNLRFVIKISFSYRTHGLKLLDLIQEGNLGLIRAVELYDPGRGCRIISYAVWWIRAYIKNYIIRSRSLVKIGTTQAQRKLFYRIGELPETFDLDDHKANVAKLAERVGVKEDEVINMAARLKAHDLSLDEPIGDMLKDSFADTMPYDGPNQEQTLAELQDLENLKVWARQALETLNPREKYIVKNRVLAEKRSTLKQLGKNLGITRERVRQIERVALGKLESHYEQFHMVAGSY